MPQRRHVGSLHTIAFHRIAYTITDWFKEHQKYHHTCQSITSKCPTLRAVRNQITKMLPEYVINHLRNLMIKDHFTRKSDRKKRLGVMYLFWTNTASTLDIFHDKEIRDLSQVFFKSIQYLKLSFEHIRTKPFGSMKHKLFLDVIYSTQRLVSLQLNCVIATETLRVIGITCNQLKELKTFVGTEIYDTGEGYLQLGFKDYPQNETLNNLCLTLETLQVVTFSDQDEFFIQEVIQYNKPFMNAVCQLVENLFALKNLSVSVGGHVLARLSTENKDFSPFIEHVYDSRTDKRVGDGLNLCGNLKSLHVLYPRNYGFFLQSLNDCKNLIQLKVQSGITLKASFSAFIQNHKQLALLRIETFHGEFDFSELAQCCPNLEALSIGAKSFSYNEPAEVFNQLKILYIHKYWTHDDFIKLLTNAPNLQFLEVADCSEMTNERAENITTTSMLPNLVNLKFLRLDKGVVKFSTIKNLIYHCPKLTYFGTYRFVPEERGELFLFNKEMAAGNFNFYLEVMFDD